MLLTTAMNSVLEVFPHATIGEDNEGQLIIYTDKRLSDDPQGHIAVVDFVVP